MSMGLLQVAFRFSGSYINASCLIFATEPFNGLAPIIRIKALTVVTRPERLELATVVCSKHHHYSSGNLRHNLEGPADFFGRSGFPLGSSGQCLSTSIYSTAQTDIDRERERERKTGREGGREREGERESEGERDREGERGREAERERERDDRGGDGERQRDRQCVRTVNSQDFDPDLALPWT